MSGTVCGVPVSAAYVSSSALRCESGLICVHVVAGASQPSFLLWGRARAANDPLFRLWWFWATEPMIGFRALRLATRTGNYRLRIEALAKLAPFTLCYCGRNYQRVVMAELQQCAAADDDMERCFVVNVGGSNLDVDEAHEMLVRARRLTPCLLIVACGCG